MNFKDVELPSNKKFGYFFTLIFSMGFVYFYINNILIWAYILVVIAVIFFIITISKSDLLLPLNKLWIRFGVLLSYVANPIVMGILFFGMFTPIAFFMRLRGRDELHLKFKNKKSYWLERNEKVEITSFKRQY